MALPLKPPVSPQLARPRAGLPDGENWAYEPKWDGFRALAFVDGELTCLHSRNGRDLERYFPELDFIHPAQSRIERLAGETPARFVAFDVLAHDDESLLERTYAERRAVLEEIVDKPVDLTPCTRTREEAEPWLRSAEGVIAKQLDAPYRPGERTGMVKIKRVRTIDAVVCGWRPGKEEGTVGALILGLYDTDGQLRVVGHSSGLKAKEKRELVTTLAPYETGQRGSGEPSRWSQGRDLEWVELRPELVVEVSFDHVSAGRIRHGSKLNRWREDKDPRECQLEQLYS